MNRNYIAIEGNIGAGKTSLAKMLAKHWGAKLLLEEFAENPFLPLFYEDPARHAFSVELYFLADRYHQLGGGVVAPNLFNEVVVADYFIAKSRIFAGETLKESELELFNRLFDIMFTTIPRPDLLVYLYLDVEGLMANIRKRGRPFEQNIERTYLENVQKRYLQFIRQQPDLTALIIDVKGLDFVGNPKDFHTLLEIIDKEYPKGVHTVNPLA